MKRLNGLIMGVSVCEARRAIKIGNTALISRANDDSGEIGYRRWCLVRERSLRVSPA